MTDSRSVDSGKSGGVWYEELGKTRGSYTFTHNLLTITDTPFSCYQLKLQHRYGLLLRWVINYH